MLVEGTFPRGPPRVSAASAVSTVTALAFGSGLGLDVAFVVLALGLLLSYLVIMTLGVRLWRSSRAPRSPADRPEPALGVSGRE